MSRGWTIALIAFLAVLTLAGVGDAQEAPAGPARPPLAVATVPVPPGGRVPIRASLMHEGWTDVDGAPRAHVLVLHESRDGFLWLGTERGLFRFDGFGFSRAEPALDSIVGEATVRAVVQSPDGALWISVLDRGVVRWRGGVATVFDTTSGLPDHDVRSLLVAPSGTLWVGGGTGVARLSGERFSRVRSAPQRAQALSSAPDGEVWVASPALARVRGDSIERVAVDGMLPGEEALAIHWARDGSLWVGTVSALLRVTRSGTPATWRVATRYDAVRGLASPYVRSIAEDDAGRIWAASSGAGVAVVERGDLVRLDSRDGLSDDGARAVHAGAGAVWVGTTQGLDAFRPRLLRSITTLHGLAPHFLWSVAADERGVWLGTSGGGLYWADGDGGLRRSAAPLASGIVYGVMSTADGTLWLRTGAGLSRYRDGASVAIPALTAAERAAGRAAFVDRDGGLWLGGEFGVVHVNGGRVRRLAPAREAPTRYTEAFAQTADGTVWMKGRDIVGHRAGRIVRYGVAQGVRSVTAIAADGDDLWVGTYDEGLRLIRRGRFHAFPGVPMHRRIFAVIGDDADGLWIATDLGLQRISRSALRARADGDRAEVAVRTFDRRHGLWNLEFNVAGANPATRDASGRLWFANVHGAVMVDPARIPPPAAAPTPVIDAVLVDARAYPRTQPGRPAEEVPRGRGGLELRYTAPALEDADGLSFRYRLIGYDSGWTHVGRRRAAVFTGVPGRTFRFEVQASREDGAWSPIAATTIALRPRLVDRTAFRVAIVLALLAATFVAVSLATRRRTLRLQARAASLEALVESRTVELQSLNADLERRVEARTAELRAQHAERLRLEENLQQAQKLDSIGRLAGGIAHDLNNLLTAILSFAEFAEEQSSDPAQRSDLQEVRTAGRRASNLTQQLLAFARRQVIAPRVLDLNEVVTELGALLRRLLGADVELVITAADDLAPVRMDPSQVEQVLVNLAVNARDAMPDGGCLVIELANCRLDEAGASRLGIGAGDYVRLSVADTGQGMPPEVRRRLFEPFFTTKDVGRGTGLGLATCYGIVAQAGGMIDVATEVGRGTRFEVWLPRTAAPASAASAAEASVLPRGVETIMVVDDEEQVRAAARRVLARCGYTVVEATDGQNAIETADALTEPPALLLSDLVMPRLGGQEVARRLTQRWPRLRVLLMSGYVERPLSPDGAVTHGFLAKPFTPASLARRVREALDEAGA